MTNRKFVTTGENIPIYNSPISQAVVAGNYCHISGQLAFGKDGEFIGGTIKEQAEIAFKNLFAVLDEAGFQREEIVFIDMAFTNLNDLMEITPFYDSLFAKDKKPARTIYEASALPAGGKIKVMAIAIRT
jgi:2-iminobutanoate/2-iminopropanoate deaminase